MSSTTDNDNSGSNDSNSNRWFCEDEVSPVEENKTGEWDRNGSPVVLNKIKEY